MVANETSPIEALALPCGFCDVRWFGLVIIVGLSLEWCLAWAQMLSHILSLMGLVSQQPHFHDARCQSFP